MCDDPFDHRLFRHLGHAQTVEPPARAVSQDQGDPRDRSWCFLLRDRSAHRLVHVHAVSCTETAGRRHCVVRAPFGRRKLIYSTPDKKKKRQDRWNIQRCGGEGSSCCCRGNYGQHGHVSNNVQETNEWTGGVTDCIHRRRCSNRWMQPYIRFEKQVFCDTSTGQELGDLLSVIVFSSGRHCLRYGKEDGNRQRCIRCRGHFPNPPLETKKTR